MLVNMIDVLNEREILLPAITQAMPRIIVYSNDIIPAAYDARTAQFAPIVFGKLPSEVILGGGEFFIAGCHDGIIAETIPHYLRDKPDEISRICDSTQEADAIYAECVLLTRYGHGTWGHWLGEILPLAVVTEHAYPGRFRYAIPMRSGSYGDAMVDSLAAYGITPDRLISVQYNRPVRMTNAWALTPIWSDTAPHPTAIDLMRDTVTAPQWPGASKVALMRRDWRTRGIVNGAEVEEILRGHAFAITDAAVLRFADQVRMFQCATAIFGVLGSGLTGLIYSPHAVRVTSAAPATWGDRFFYGLGQHRRAVWAEVRGPSEWDGKTGQLRDAAFTVPVQQLHEAMESVGWHQPVLVE